MNTPAFSFLLLTCLTVALCQSCKPSSPLTSKQSEQSLEDTFPSHLVDSVAVEESVPEDLEVPEEIEPESGYGMENETESTGPPDWKVRYQELLAEYKNAFVPPAGGNKVKLPLTTGQVQEGRLVSLKEDRVILEVFAGEIEVQRQMLAKKVRVRLFADDYAKEKALRVVKMEKRKYDLAQQQREVAAQEAASLAKNREAAKNRGKVVLPVNDPRDGSVPAVVAYIKRTTRNPDSIKFLQWYKVIPKDGKYIVRCRYRADGGELGELTLDKYFFLNASGRVYQSANYKGS